MPADFATVQPQIEQELIAKGFKQESPNGSAIATSAYRRIAKVTPTFTVEDSITIHKDKRFRTGRPPEIFPVAMDNQPGWISVEVMYWVQQSPLESLVSLCRQRMGGTQIYQGPLPR